MHRELRKLAALLRKKAQAQETEKLIKCASITQAMIGLMFLKRKLGC